MTSSEGINQANHILRFSNHVLWPWPCQCLGPAMRVLSEPERDIWEAVLQKVLS